MKRLQDFLNNFSKTMEKFFFTLSASTRLELFKVIISQLNGGRSIKKTIEKRIEKHHKRHAKLGAFKRILSKPGGSEMPFLIHVNTTLLKGESFSKSIQGGWVSDNEAMLIKSGGDGKLKESLTMSSDLLSDLGDMKKTLKKELTYPIVLFIVLLIMIFAFSFKMIPILTSLSDPEDWEGSARTLYDFCMFFKNNAAVFLSSLMLTIIGIYKTLPLWTGKYREKFDSLFPWSIYKEFQAGVFLISLSTLMKSGIQLVNSLNSLEKQSPLYVRQYLRIMINRMNASESGATAINTHLLGDLGDDIEDLTEMGDFQSILLDYGHQAVDVINDSISAKAGKIKSIMMILVFSFVGWGYGTFVGISQSITDNM